MKKHIVVALGVTILLNQYDIIFGSPTLKNHVPQLNKTSKNKRISSTSFQKKPTANAFVNANFHNVPSGGSDEGSEDNTGLSITESAFNLVKSCLGTGILSLPAGVAAMGDVSGALLPASVIMAVLGGLSAYSFYIVGKLCDMEDANSLGDAWEKVIGKDSSWLVTLTCFLTPLGVALSFSIVLGDFLSSLAASAGLKGFMATRHFGILAITTLVVYPLTLLKSLKALAPVSIVGVLGVIISAVFMGLRMKTGSYSEGGEFYETIASSLQPSFGQKGLNVLNPSTSILCSMAATAYLAHFLAPDFYRDLKNPSMKRFGILSGVGFAATALISIAMMCLGFLTFGGNASGMILNNYSSVDPGAVLVRLLTIVSVVGSYPFIFGAIRSSYLELTAKNDGEAVSEKVRINITRQLLAGITVLALLLENAGFVVSFNGALMGSAIIYIFPPLLYMTSIRNRVNSGMIDNTAGVKIETVFNKFLLVLGVILGLLGGTVSVLDAFFPNIL